MRAGHGHALLLASGENSRGILAAPLETYPLERLADAAPNEARREPEHLGGDRDVLEDGPGRRRA